MKLQIFDKDDNEYLEQMKKNPPCFVVNTQRIKNSKIFVLHKSGCHHITSTEGFPKGVYTKNNHIKIGSSNLNELKSWFIQHKTNFKGEFKECGTCKPFSEKLINTPIHLFPDTIEDETEVLFEGAKKQITVNSYERNIKARQKCLKYHGYLCSVCKIDFKKKYGSIGESFSHVHHLKEISDIGSEYRIDPKNDLIPVCPNCHAMLHQKKPCYTVDELISIIAEQ